jgi:ubiquinone/menaquinone biosynthesis C-methylase UbiE
MLRLHSPPGSGATVLRRYPITLGLLFAFGASFWLALRASRPSIPTRPADIPFEVAAEVNKLYRLNKFTLVDHEDHEVWRMVEKRHERHEDVIAKLPLEPGMTVADLGCGLGVYSFPMAEAVGPTGRVLALDIEAAALEVLEARAEDLYAGVHTNVEPRLTTPDDPQLEHGSVDMVFMAHLDILMAETLLPETHSLMQRVELAIVPGGRLAVLQWFRPNDRVDYIVQQAERYGFYYEALHELHYDRLLRNTTQPEDQVSYLMIFRKPRAVPAP